MQKAVAYIRVSTEGQVNEGVSLDAQRARIDAWALANGYELESAHVDAGLSGKRADNRPGLQEAVERACRMKAALVVYSLSRLARSTKDAIAISERLDKAGADLVSLSEKIDTTSAAGKMVFRMLAVLAEFERDLISERTASAMQHMRSESKLVGKVPFGFVLANDGETLERSEKEQQTITLIQSLHGNGLSLRAIAKKLALKKVCTKSGGNSWSPKVISSIIKRMKTA